MGTETFYADGRTDMTRPTILFHNFAIAPIKEIEETPNYCVKFETPVK
jgi:hypothetical protein